MGKDEIYSMYSGLNQEKIETARNSRRELKEHERDIGLMRDPADLITHIEANAMEYMADLKSPEATPAFRILKMAQYLRESLGLK